MTQLMLTHPAHAGWHWHCLHMAGHHRRDDDGERDQHMQEPLNHGKELLRRRLDFKMQASSPSTSRDAGRTRHYVNVAVIMQAPSIGVQLVAR